jgi:hypothetical protein
MIYPLNVSLIHGGEGSPISTKPLARRWLRRLVVFTGLIDFGDGNINLPKCKGKEVSDAAPDGSNNINDATARSVCIHDGFEGKN